MNGLHGISLKDEASKAEEGSCVVCACGGAECLKPHRQSSIIYPGVNSYDRGSLSLSSVQTLGLVSVSRDEMCIRLHLAD